ncbi:hypothetical protein [Thalassobaculum sp.]|uniref:hypothetical protein n=1 Tax=Thalassobaculum sp. TaxID=2022740 RepID=UPI0032ECA730
MLDGLRRNLMQPGAVKAFVTEFNAELTRLWTAKGAGRAAREQELARVQKDLDRAVGRGSDGPAFSRDPGQPDRAGGPQGRAQD